MEPMEIPNIISSLVYTGRKEAGYTPLELGWYSDKTRCGVGGLSERQAKQVHVRRAVQEDVSRRKIGSVLSSHVSCLWQGSVRLSGVFRIHSGIVQWRHVVLTSGKIGPWPLFFLHTSPTCPIINLLK